MNHTGAAQSSAVAQFRALHESGCFVLPNPWDVGTAIYLQHLGFKALATTSAGFAFSCGLSDGKVPRDEMLAHIREIAAATPLPVNADFLNGFAAEPEAVAANVKLCVAMGAAGLSIEDSTGNDTAPLYEERLAIERVRAARRAIDDSKIPVVLTGRCEAWLVGHPDALNFARKRLVAYAEAGADCLYAPGVREPDEIAELVKVAAQRKTLGRALGRSRRSPDLSRISSGLRLLGLVHPGRARDRANRRLRFAVWRRPLRRDQQRLR